MDAAGRGSATVENVNLLLGGLITLAVTAVVQILIIPWVQRRNRRIERWEKDVIELVNLLEVGLPTALRSARHSATGPLSVAEVLRDLEPGNSAERLRKEFGPAVKQAHVEYLALVDLTSHARLLERRVELVRRRAPYWRQLRTSVLRLSIFAIGLDPYNLSLDAGYDFDAYDQGFTAFGERVKNVLELLRVVSDHTKPPQGRLRAFATRRAQAARPRSTPSAAMEVD
jgi:hypothetical protein